MAAAGSILVLLATVVLLARPPAVLRGRPEVLAVAPGALVVVAVGWEPLDGVRREVTRLAPTLLFLLGVLLIAGACEAAGLFDLVGQRLAGLAGRGDRWLVVGVGALALLVTSTLSLDATVVLFTPVVIRLVRGRRVADPALLVTVLIANAGSLALPVANLTNLLVIERTGISYGAFTARLLVPALVSTAIVIAVCARQARPAAARSAGEPVGSLEPLEPVGSGSVESGGSVGSLAARQRVGPLELVVALGTAVALAGFFVASSFGAEPAWVALPVGVALAALVLAAGRSTPPVLVRRAGPDFLVFVVALAVVVDAAARHGLDRVAGWSPTGVGLLSLLGMALLAAALANVVNNLPATLLLLPVLAHRPTPIALAALIGLNVGPNLSYPGSLATLLWRRVTAAERVEPPARAFHRAGLISTPLALVAAVVCLWASVAAFP